MSWSQVAWLNNKIRIPDREKRITACKDVVIKATTDATRTGNTFTTTFTPKYSGTICVVGHIVMVDNSSKYNVNTGSISSNASIYVNNELYSVPFTESNYYDTGISGTGKCIMAKAYFYVPVTANTQIEIKYICDSTANIPLLICGIVAEEA